MAELIAAVATAPQKAAIGILRLSGDGAIAAADRVFRAKSGRKLSETPDRHAVLGVLTDENGIPLDEVLATVSRAPATYTGEETAELSCHGSPAVLAAGLDALFAAGARQARAGEFTKRAFLSGRMDLSQAEAVADLIDAETADAAKNAAGQLGGAVARRIAPVYDALVDVMSHFHAVLDYPDEEIEPFELGRLAEVLASQEAALSALAGTFARGKILRDGVRAAIVGQPNVGKSSLLNVLCGFDRAIVTAAAGTTRDTVEEKIVLGGVTVRLCDTAGIRETENDAERQGVARARAAAEEAELALFVCDGSSPLGEADLAAMAAAKSAAHAIAIRNKCDLGLAPQDIFDGFDAVLAVSAATGEGLAALESAVCRIFGGVTPPDGGILTNARQHGAVVRAAQSVKAAEASLRGGMTPDAVLVDVECALSALGEVTGRTMREDITSRIFERFCVGK